jgi:SAM-dependent methyltransferase
LGGDGREMMNKRPFSGSFQNHEVEDYEKRRYRGLDQRLVDRREKRILRRILEGIDEDVNRVLDIPCGYGRFSDLLLEKGLVLVSSDLSFHMVSRARKRSPGKKNHSVVVCDAKKGLPFKKGSFSSVLSMRFFHHLHKKEERLSVLKEFSRVCARWVILSYYRRNRLHSLQRKLRKRIKKSKRRIHMISRRDFEQEVNGIGLSVVKVFPLFRILHAQSIVLLRRF